MVRFRIICVAAVAVFLSVSTGLVSHEGVAGVWTTGLFVGGVFAALLVTLSAISTLASRDLKRFTDEGP